MNPIISIETEGVGTLVSREQQGSIGVGQLINSEPKDSRSGSSIAIVTAHLKRDALQQTVRWRGDESLARTNTAIVGVSIVIDVFGADVADGRIIYQRHIWSAGEICDVKNSRGWENGNSTDVGTQVVNRYDGLAEGGTGQDGERQAR